MHTFFIIKITVCINNQVRNWTSIEEIQRIDKEKNKMALSNKIKLIRICQEMVYNNTCNWELCLMSKLYTNEPITFIGNKYNK